MAGFTLHSVVVGDTEIQLTYSDPDARTSAGMEIPTAVMSGAVVPALAAEVAELTDAAEQLLASWKGLMREAAGP